MLYKIWGFHGGDYKDFRPLGYKHPVHTSQKKHYVSVTESNQLMLKIWGFHDDDYKEFRLWDIHPSVYRTGNTLILRYRFQPVNAT
jgi:hypothetical protein